MKDMACRSFLLKLERKGFITLPPRKISRPRGSRTVEVPPILHSTDPITSSLKNLQPVRVELVDAGNLALFKCLISRYHYLSLHQVGKNMKYLSLIHI